MRTLYRSFGFVPALTTIIIFLCSCNRQPTVFTVLPSSQTGISFTNKLPEKERFNILYYLYYYNGGGVAIGDVNNDGLSDVYFTANTRGANKLYLNKGNFQFEDVTEKAGVSGTADWCSGVTLADVNSDGFLDIYVSTVSGAYNLKGHNLLYINNGGKGNDIRFTESSAEYGLNFSGLSTQAAFFDYDHDGDLDCYLLNHSHHPHANVVDTANRRKPDALSGDRFYRNDLNTGSKKFSDISQAAGIYRSNLGYGLGLAVADFNNDGWDDVYVGNDFHENDYYYLNNGNGSFTESGAKHFGHYSRFSMGNDAADYNNDGQIDLVTVDMLPPEEKVLKTYGSDENPDIYKMKLMVNGYQHQYSRNVLQRNNGSGASFSDEALLAGVSATDWSWTPLFADFDNDGKKDLFISSGIVKRPVDLDYIRFVSDLSMQKGMDKTDKYDKEAIDKMPDGSSQPYFFRGSGAMGFEEVSNEWGTAKLKGYFNGAAYGDLDNDGTLDLVINCINAPAVVLKNNSKAKNYISLSFRGDSLNKFGVGCKAYLFQNGKMQFQQLMQTRGFQSASDSRLHFGLDSTASVDSLLVVWPDQKFQVVKHPKTNQQLIVEKSGASGVFSYADYFTPLPQLLQAQNVKVQWKHSEDDFVDYNIQYLIPHAQSTRGPKIAVADVNADGLDDFYACGGRGQAGALMLQQPNGSFLPNAKEVFAADAACEDVDAIFFDANGDRFPDLYVVSGGNVANGNNPELLDRLYINNGKGVFQKSASSLPGILANKSCVAAADVEGDGDLDVFVGGLADARAYGIPQSSYLLLNNGKGQFSIAPPAFISLQSIGMVTAAAFSDFNNDDRPDLAIAGEWMPLTIFLNQNGKFIKKELPASSGWWQTLFVDDVNGDGNADILAGNWGLNNKFVQDKSGPVRLYVSDFDKNGRVDQLLSYTRGGKEYPFLAKDEVERALPVLRKHYLYYKDFAGLEMKDAYYGFAETVTPLVAEKLASCVFFGDGKGGFTMKELPPPLQMAPIFTFQKILQSNSGSHYLAGGNFFDVIPYEGRYDAQPLAMFSVGRNGNVRYVHQAQLYEHRGQVRDVKWISRKTKQLVVASSNDSLKFYQLKNNR